MLALTAVWIFILVVPSDLVRYAAFIVAALILFSSDKDLISWETSRDKRLRHEEEAQLIKQGSKSLRLDSYTGLIALYVGGFLIFLFFATNSIWQFLGFAALLYLPVTYYLFISVWAWIGKVLKGLRKW